METSNQGTNNTTNRNNINTRSFLIIQGTTPILLSRKETFIMALQKADMQRNSDSQATITWFPSTHYPTHQLTRPAPWHESYKRTCENLNEIWGREPLLPRRYPVIHCSATLLHVSQLQHQRRCPQPNKNYTCFHASCSKILASPCCYCRMSHTLQSGLKIIVNTIKPVQWNIFDSLMTHFATFAKMVQEIFIFGEKKTRTQFFRYCCVVLHEG